MGLRDRAILAVLVYTAARVAAVAKLTLKSLKHDGSQCTMRFAERGGKFGAVPAGVRRGRQDRRGPPLPHGEAPTDIIFLTSHSIS